MDSLIKQFDKLYGNPPNIKTSIKKKMELRVKKLYLKDPEIKVFLKGLLEISAEFTKAQSSGDRETCYQLATNLAQYLRPITEVQEFSDMVDKMDDETKKLLLKTKFGGVGERNYE